MGPIINIFLIREQCMHSVWTVHTLFITVNVVSQSQQMKKKKKEEKTRFENADAGLIAIQTPSKSIITKQHYKLEKKGWNNKRMAKNPFSSLYFLAIPTLVPIFYFHRF